MRTGLRSLTVVRSLTPRALALSTALLSAGPLAAQEAPPPALELAFVHDSGYAANEGADARVVHSFTVRIDGARWLRLHFDDVELSGDPLRGTGSLLRLSAWEDGAVQELDALHCREWQNSSAYFNGDAVQVEVLAWPGTGPNRVAMSKLFVGLAAGGFETICGPTDDRVPSADPRAARVLPVGCTGWLIDDCKGCFLTAGHCGSVNVAEFQVPPSDPDGTLNHPGPEDQYAVDPASVQAEAGGTGNDWRTFGCFPNPLTGLTPADAQGATFALELPPSYGPGQSVRITGYGTDDTPNTYNQVQQTHVGPRMSSGGTTLEYVTDTTGGNSGSPVIWEEAGVAIGIHTNGGCGGSGGTNLGTSSANAALQLALSDPRGVCATGVQVLTPLPDLIAPGETVKLDVRIAPPVVPGSATLHVSYDGGPFFELPLAPTGGDLYQASLPRPVCGATPRYWFSVVDGDCGASTTPEAGPAAPFEALVGVETLVLEDDLESATGWIGGQPGDTATTGQWTRVDPNGTQAQPEDDHSVPGTLCWVTGQGSPGGSQGADDVDDGFTTLLSPVFDLSGLAEPVIDYWRWYSNATGAGPNTDVLTVSISNDGGANWTVAEVVGPTGPDTAPGWRFHQLVVAELLPPTDQVRLRFVAADLSPGSIVEAAVDDLRVRDVTCDAVLADCNGNGVLDADDIALGLSPDVDLDGVPDECGTDCNGNGVPDGLELVATPYCACDAAAPCANPGAPGGCANSTGAGARLAACGSGSVTADDAQLVASALPAGQNALVYMGQGAIQVPFGDGLRCVGAGGAGTFRFPVRSTGAGGTFTEGPGLAAYAQATFPPAGGIDPGETWNFQAWYRDPAGPCGTGFNLSNAVAVSFAP